jgi:ABC-type transporter Mla MlaB component
MTASRDSPPTARIVVRGPIARDDLPGLSERVCALFAGLGEDAGAVVHCEVSSVAPDAVTIEALARLTLVARRAGCTVRLCHASDELMALVAFLGLCDVLRL